MSGSLQDGGGIRDGVTSAGTGTEPAGCGLEGEGMSRSCSGGLERYAALGSPLEPMDEAKRCEATLVYSTTEAHDLSGSSTGGSRGRREGSGNRTAEHSGSPGSRSGAWQADDVRGSSTGGSYGAHNVCGSAPERQSPSVLGHSRQAARCQQRDPLDAAGGDRHRTAFLRLHAFLLRSHAKSLIAALETDGWLEQQEGARLKESCNKDRLLSKNDTPESQAFVSAYSQFMATEDIWEFVGQLKAMA